MVDIKKSRSIRPSNIKNQPAGQPRPAAQGGPAKADALSLDKAVDSLSEQKRKYDIAMFYTHQDAEKAKNMVAGAYKDMYAIKAKFSVSTTYGVFIAFFNMTYCTLAHSYAVMSHSYVVDDLKTISPWRDFEKQMNDLDNQGGHDGELTSKMKHDLAQTFTMQMGTTQRATELRKNLEANDQMNATRIIQKFIRDKFGFQNINLAVDYEQISSLDMELNSITSKKLDKELASSEPENMEEEIKVETEEEEEDIDKKDVQIILRGGLVLSPVKGKEISTIVTGDKIKVTLDSSNPKAVTVAKAFKSYDDGKMLPIMGRVVSIRHLLDGGYRIYCIIAKGIYVKIEEEEEGIKIAAEIQGGQEETIHHYTPVIVAAVVVFFILIAIILALLFK